MTQFLAFYRIPSVVAQVGAFNDTVVTCSQLASNECMSMLVAGNNICKYGPDRVKDFCATAGLKLVIRAHECVQDGYQYFASCHLITVFSATNYCARHGNDGAFLEISIDRGQVCGASCTICLVTVYSFLRFLPQLSCCARDRQPLQLNVVPKVRFTQTF